jgi:hypothetical protein
LLYTSFNLLSKVAEGKVHGEALIGNGLMGVVGLFLVVAAFILLIDGLKALKRYRQQPGVGIVPEAK